MPSKRVRQGQTQWVGQINRKDFRKEQVFDSKADASAWEAEVRKLLRSALPREDIRGLLEEGVLPEQVPEAWERMQRKIATLSLLDWANDYLDSVPGISAKTRQEKRDVFKSLFKCLDPHMPVLSLTPGHALDFLNKQFRERSGHAANKDRKNLIAAWNWGVQFREFPERNPFKAVKQFRHDAEGHYVPPLDDFLKVLDVAEGQDKVMLLTFLHTAGRRGEIYQLKWEDVAFDPRNARIRLKTRKTRDGSLESAWLPMNDELREALIEHKESAGSREYVFTVQEGRGAGKPFKWRRTWPKNLCQEAGVKPFGCHGIRGLSGSLLAAGDVPMKIIQQHLRHKNLGTTERYVRGLDPIRPYLKVLEGGRRTMAA